MNKNFILGILLCYPVFTFSQAGQWTWMKGDSVCCNPGIYGTQGVSSPLNQPGGRYEGGEFTGLNGTFWLYGGSGYDVTGNLGFLEDLWKFDPASNEWTWIKGANTTGQTAVFGTKGIPSPANSPGGKWAFVTWSGINGDFWLYGGSGSGNYNDLWRYQAATNEWTWMHGSATNGAGAVHGTKGVPSPANTPGARNETSCSWVDQAGNLWLFGGASGSAAVGSFNDLWKYDIGTNEWTWVSGDNTLNAASVHGVLGVPNPANKPGARYAYCSWMDLQGNLYLFGGIRTGNWNDLWRYDPVSDLWTWMSGSNSASLGSGNIASGICDAAAANTPGRRFENRIRWTDACGNFWTFGGFPHYADLWHYQVSSNEWSFINGDTIGTAPGFYGIQGLTSPLNKPGYRFGGLSWKDDQGNLWLFGGGSGAGDLNDLWKYVPDSSCHGCGGVQALPDVSFVSSDTVFCDKKCLDFTDLSTNNPTSWQWSFPGAVPSSDTVQNPTNICYNAYGTFDVTLIACNAAGCDTLFVPSFITEYQLPQQPIIVQSNDTLYCTTAFSYAWYNTANPGVVLSTDSFYTTSSGGSYFVIVSDSLGCQNSSAVFSATGIPVHLGSIETMLVIQSADGDWLDILLSRGPDKSPYELEIFNTTGQVVFHSLLFRKDNRIGIRNLKGGIYFLRLRTDHGYLSGRTGIIR